MNQFQVLCKRDHLGYLRVILPAELEYFSDFIEDIVSVDEADEYLKLIQDVLDGSSEEYEIQLNTTVAYIKEDQTVIEHLYTMSSMKSEKYSNSAGRITRKYPKWSLLHSNEYSIIKSIIPLVFYIKDMQ